MALVLVLTLTGNDDSQKAGGDGGTSEDSGLPGGVPGPNGSGSGEDSGDSPAAGDSSGGGGRGGSGGVSTLEGLADLVVEVGETQDEDLIDEHACSSGDAAQLKSELSQLAGVDVSATVEDVRESGDTAQASIEMSLSGQTEGFTAEMEKDGGAWCVSEI